jgi:antitoxin FitA
MRQLIARIDDELHDRLKARAAAERRSLNSLVQELLVQGLPADERERVRARAETSGLRVVPRRERRPPSREAAIAATRGAGRAASEALAAERARR